MSARIVFVIIVSVCGLLSAIFSSINLFTILPSNPDFISTAISFFFGWTAGRTKTVHRTSLTSVSTSKIFIILFLIFFTVPLLTYVIWKLIVGLKIKVPLKISSKTPNLRFRNRDKIRFHAIRLSRMFASMTSKLNEMTTREERKKVIANFVKRGQDKRDPILMQRNLPESFLQPEPEEKISNLEDLNFLLNRVRILKYLGRKVVVGLSDMLRTVELNVGDYLFCEGEVQKNIFVVKSGIVELKITDQDGSETTVHEVSTGGNPYSLIAVIDVMMGRPSTYKCVQARATCETSVIVLSMADLLGVCRQYPFAIPRLAQMVSVHIQRVIFAAMHNFFGLDKELFSDTTSKLIEDSAVTALLLRRDADSTEAKAIPILERQLVDKHVDAIPIPVQTPPVITLLYPAKSPKFDNDDDDAETASIDEVLATVGMDSVSTNLLPCTPPVRPADLLELGEVFPPVNEAGLVEGAAGPSSPDTYNDSSDISDVENFDGATGIERRLVATMVPIKTPQHSQHRQAIPIANESSDPLLFAAQQDIAQLFGLTDCRILDGLVSIVSVHPGHVLAKEHELQAEMYYILSGEIHVMQAVVGGTVASTTTNQSPMKPSAVLTCGAGEVIGLLGVITGEPNNTSFFVNRPTELAVLPREHFFSLIRLHPNVLMHATYVMSKRLSSLLRLSDFALEWHVVDAGKALYMQGDASKYIYVVLNGRFREVRTFPDGNKQVMSEMGRGAFIGFVEVASERARLNTVLAIIESEVVQIPWLMLHWLRRIAFHPVSRFIQLLSDRVIIGSLQPSIRSFPGVNQIGHSMGSIPGGGPLNQQSLPADDAFVVGGGAMANLRAIAIIPASSDVNADAFCLELQHAVSVFGRSLRLNHDIISKRVGSSALEPTNEYRLSSWLNHQEDRHRITFYIGDSGKVTPWNMRCVRQADCVMVLALASGAPNHISAVEDFVSKDASKVTKLLVLMYPLETDYPPAKSTAAWLNARPWVNQHYHIRCPSRVLVNRPAAKLIHHYCRVFAEEKPDPHSDVSRLVRYFVDQAVGLVLGGGGARGGAHVGVIRAFQDSGIPIDMVGGTSIGALVGALWAEETKVAQSSQRARDFALIFTSIWPKLRDLTYPTVSFFSGYEFNSQLEATFKDRQIEDLWLPYFCITTDITNCKMRVHTSGSLWRYVRSSMSYPMLLPPLCDPKDGHQLLDGAFVNNLPGSLWRYVRSSMSLSGYMPPLCDPYDGSYLLDGGYVNNVPADVMTSFGAKTVYAVDVGSVFDTNLTNYGDWLSGWWLIYQRLFRRWGPPIRVPNQSQIQDRLAYISCIRQLEAVKNSGICHYLRPPIEHYGTLQFSAFEEIRNIGHNYTKELLETWKSNGLLKQMMPGIYRPEMFNDGHFRRASRGFDLRALMERPLCEEQPVPQYTASVADAVPSASRNIGSPSHMKDSVEGPVIHFERASSLQLGSSALLPKTFNVRQPLAEPWLDTTPADNKATSSQDTERQAAASVLLDISFLHPRKKRSLSAQNSDVDELTVLKVDSHSHGSLADDAGGQKKICSEGKQSELSQLRPTARRLFGLNATAEKVDSDGYEEDIEDLEDEYYLDSLGGDDSSFHHMTSSNPELFSDNFDLGSSTNGDNGTRVTGGPNTFPVTDVTTDSKRRSWRSRGLSELLGIDEWQKSKEDIPQESKTIAPDRVDHTLLPHSSSPPQKRHKLRHRNLLNRIRSAMQPSPNKGEVSSPP